MKDGERGWVNRISSSLKSQWKSFFRNGKIFFRSFQSLPLGFLHINNINNIHSCCLLEFDTRMEICCLRFIFFGWNWQHEFIEEFLLYYFNQWFVSCTNLIQSIWFFYSTVFINDLYILLILTLLDWSTIDIFHYFDSWFIYSKLTIDPKLKK